MISFASNMVHKCRHHNSKKECTSKKMRVVVVGGGQRVNNSFNYHQFSLCRFWFDLSTRGGTVSFHFIGFGQFAMQKIRACGRMPISGGSPSRHAKPPIVQRLSPGDAPFLWQILMSKVSICTMRGGRESHLTGHLWTLMSVSGTLLIINKGSSKGVALWSTTHTLCVNRIFFCCSKAKNLKKYCQPRAAVKIRGLWGVIAALWERLAES